MEDVNISDDKIFFLFLKSECSPQEINSRQICLHQTFSAHFERTLIHFKSYVFAAVAVVDAKTL